MAGINFPQGNQLGSDQNALAQEPPPAEKQPFTEVLSDLLPGEMSERGKRAQAAREAVSDQAWDDTAVGLWARNSALNELKERKGKELSPEEANKLYPYMQTPFTKPVSALVAQYLGDQEVERRKREEAIRKGPQDLWNQGRNFGAGVIQHLMDPIETGTMLIGGAVFGAAARAGTLGKTVQTAAIASRAGELGLVGEVALNTVQAGTADVIQNTALEVELAGTQMREGNPYSIEEGAKNVLISSAAGPVLGAAFGLVHAGIGKAFSRDVADAIDLPSMPERTGPEFVMDVASRELDHNLRTTSPEAATAIARTSLNDFNSGRVPDPSHLMEAIAKETSIKEIPGKFSYNYEPIRGEIPAGKKLYIAADNAKLEKGKMFYTSDVLGNGAHLTDNPGVANATAARSMSDAAGMVHEVDLTGAKVLSLDEKFPFNSPEAKVFLEALKESGEPHPEGAIRDLTGREMVDFMHRMADDVDGKPSAIKVYEDGLRALGYDAVVTDGTKRLGFDGHEPHNAMMLLNEERLKSDGYMTPDLDARTQPSVDLQERTKAYRDSPLKNRFDVMNNEEFSNAIKQADDFPLEGSKLIQEAKTVLDDMMEQYQELDRQGGLTAADKRNFDSLKKSIQDIDTQRELAKAVIFCVSG